MEVLNSTTEKTADFWDMTPWEELAAPIFKVALPETLVVVAAAAAFSSSNSSSGSSSSSSSSSS
jgi:hypothetical protein